MKPTNRKLVFFLLFALPFIVLGQKASLDPVMGIGERKIASIERDYYTILLMEYDLLFESPFKRITMRNLYANRNYTVEAFGDPARITDVDVAVFLWQGDDKLEIAIDRAADSEAKVTFKTEMAGNYQIEISAYGFVEGYAAGYYGMLIYQE